MNINQKYHLIEKIILANLDRNRHTILFVKFTLIHPDGFIKEIPSLIEMFDQESISFCELDRECQPKTEYFILYLRFTFIFFKLHLKWNDINIHIV